MSLNQKLFFILLFFMIFILFVKTPDRTPIFMILIGFISNLVYGFRGSIIENIVKISPLVIIFFFVGRYFALPVLRINEMRGSYYLRLLEIFDLVSLKSRLGVSEFCII